MTEGVFLILINVIFEEQKKKVESLGNHPSTEKTDDLDWVDIEDKRLIVGENNPQVKELISEANKDAETHAKEVASQL